ncbi:MAG: L,D-transpeptidase family protein [Victivallaceae bacterium]|nr:L,D-transpeptidase family protein [Victivallaceae bacterium]
MANITYSYEPDRHDKRRSSRGGTRILIIAVMVLLFTAGAVFLILPGATTEKAAPAAEPPRTPPSVPQQEPSAPVVQKKATSPAAAPTKKAADTAPKSGANAQMDELKKIRSLSDPDAARQAYLQILTSKDVPFGSPAFRTAAQALGELNLNDYFNASARTGHFRYNVRPGDSLYKLAVTYNLPIEAIRKINKLSDAADLFVGQQLKLIKADFHVKVSKSEKLLVLYNGKDLFKAYDIGIGKEGRTPVGTFLIADKIIRPDWYAPDGRIVAFGDKENVLGTRWLKLVPTGDTDKDFIGYGIHGTWDEGSITRSLSNGCIRMKNSDVEELYVLLPRKTNVVIEN